MLPKVVRISFFLMSPQCQSSADVLCEVEPKEFSFVFLSPRSEDPEYLQFLISLGSFEVGSKVLPVWVDW